MQRRGFNNRGFHSLVGSVTEVSEEKRKCEEDRYRRQLHRDCYLERGMWTRGVHESEFPYAFVLDSPRS